MTNLYEQPPPICDLPDRGMNLAMRRESEALITVRNRCSAVLHGLPAILTL